MATLLSPDMLPEDIRNMDFGQASMPHAPEAQTPEVPYDTTTSAPDRPAIPLSPDMLSGNLRGNDSEKSGIEFSFDAFGYTQQVELVQESYADGNLAVTAYLSDPTDESFGQPWSSVTVNFGSPLQQDATVFLDTNNMGEAMLSKISQLGAFTGQFMRSGFCSYPAFSFDTEVMGNMRDLRGCDRHEPLSLEPDLHPFADSYPKQPKHTIVLKSDTVYTPRGTTRSAQTERMKKHAQEDTGARAGSQGRQLRQNAFLTPHDIQTSDGRTFEKCFVSFPKGTKVNGIDVSGFSTDVFLSDYMKKDMLEKGRATVSFKKDEPVPIWTGKKDDAEHPYQRYEVKATDLTHALKVAQDSYKAEKAAERAAAKDGVSLAGEARDMETGKDALAGDDPAKSTKSRTGQDIAQ